MFNDKNTKFVITWGSATIFATNLKFKKQQKIISKKHLMGKNGEQKTDGILENTD